MAFACDTPLECSSTEQKKDVEPSAFGDDSDSPRSLSEKETDRALKRWMDMPQMAIAVGWAKPISKRTRHLSRLLLHSLCFTS